MYAQYCPSLLLHVSMEICPIIFIVCMFGSVGRLYALANDSSYKLDDQSDHVCLISLLTVKNFFKNSLAGVMK